MKKINGFWSLCNYLTIKNVHYYKIRKKAFQSDLGIDKRLHLHLNDLELFN